MEEQCNLCGDVDATIKCMPRVLYEFLYNLPPRESECVRRWFDKHRNSAVEKCMTVVSLEYYYKR
jgi:hypothetical protein